MLVPFERSVQVVGEYLLQELNKVNDPLKRFGYKFSVAAMMYNPDSFRQKAASLGVLTSEGMVDTCAVKKGLEAAFEGGFMFSYLGLTFSRGDGDELLRRLEG